jgi:hypothetical protein
MNTPINMQQTPIIKKTRKIFGASRPKQANTKKKNPAMLSMTPIPVVSPKNRNGIMKIRLENAAIR